MFGHCFANEASAVDLDAKGLTNAHQALAVLIGGAVFLYLSVRVWKDDDMDLRVVAKTFPLVTLALAYVFAFNAPESCLSPVAFGHWIVVLLVFLNLQRVVFHRLDLPPKRCVLLHILTVFQLGSLAAAAYNEESGTSALASSAALSLVVFYLGTLLLQDAGFGSDQDLAEAVVWIFVSQAALVVVNVVGFRGFGWLPAVGVAWGCGAIEGALLVGFSLNSRESSSYCSA